MTNILNRRKKFVKIKKNKEIMADNEDKKNYQNHSLHLPNKKNNLSIYVSNRFLLRIYFGRR